VGHIECRLTNNPDQNSDVTEEDSPGNENFKEKTSVAVTEVKDKDPGGKRETTKPDSHLRTVD